MAAISQVNGLSNLYPTIQHARAENSSTEEKTKQVWADKKEAIMIGVAGLFFFGIIAVIGVALKNPMLVAFAVTYCVMMTAVIVGLIFPRCCPQSSA
jgi:hypothetical protein